MRDGSDRMAIPWQLLQFWKKEKPSKISFTRIPSNEESVLQNCFEDKRVYDAIETQVKESQDKITKMDNQRAPMTLFRKICFLLSCNVCVAYIALIVWFIPCVHRICPGTKKWNNPLPYLELTAKMKTIDNLIIFGYKNITIDDDQNDGMVLAVNSSKGLIMWSKSLDIIPLYIHCEKNFSHDTSACLIFGTTDVLLINPSNGEQIWNRRLRSDSRNRDTIPRLICGSLLEKIIIPENWKITRHLNQYELVILNINTKSIIRKKFFIPTFCKNGDLNVNPATLSDNGKNYMIFGCSSPRKIEFWTVSKTMICDEDNSSHKAAFSYHFSVQRDDEDNIDGEIMVADTGEDCIIVSWNNVLICISKENLTETWRYRLVKSALIQYVFYGHFISRKITELAIVAQDYNQHLVIILDMSNGNSLMYSEVFRKMELESASFVSGGGKPKDFLLIKVKSKISDKNSTLIDEVLQSSIFTKYVNEPVTVEAFYTIDFKKSILITPFIATTSSLRSEVVTTSNSDISLIVIEEKKNNELFVVNVVLKSWGLNSCNPSLKYEA